MPEFPAGLMKPRSNPPRKEVPPPETEKKKKGVPEIERAKHTDWSLTSQSQKKESKTTKTDKDTEGNLINIIRSTIEDAIDNKLGEKSRMHSTRSTRAMSQDSSESDVNSQNSSDVTSENARSSANNVGGHGVNGRDRDETRKFPSLSRSRQRSGSQKRMAQEVESENNKKDSPKKYTCHDVGCACSVCVKKRSETW